MGWMERAGVTRPGRGVAAAALFPLAVAVVSLLLATVAVVLLEDLLGVSDASPVYLLAVVVVAACSGRGRRWPYRWSPSSSTTSCSRCPASPWSLPTPGMAQPPPVPGRGRGDRPSGGAAPRARRDGGSADRRGPGAGGDQPRDRHRGLGRGGGPRDRPAPPAGHGDGAGLDHAWRRRRAGNGPARRRRPTLHGAVPGAVDPPPPARR